MHNFIFKHNDLYSTINDKYEKISLYTGTNTITPISTKGFNVNEVGFASLHAWHSKIVLHLIILKIIFLGKWQCGIYYDLMNDNNIV